MTTGRLIAKEAIPEIGKRYFASNIMEFVTVSKINSMEITTDDDKKIRIKDIKDILLDYNGISYKVNYPSAEQFIRYRLYKNVEFEIVNNIAIIKVQEFKIFYDKIEKFTSVGRYNVNVPISMVSNNINDFIKDHNLQLCPDFQRGHVWTEQQQIKYIEYLLKGGQSAKIIYFNHPQWMNSFKGDFVCVDGLQRLTAIMKFFNNEIKAFDAYYHEFNMIPTEVDVIFCINNLKTRKEVLKWYLEMNSGGTIHTDDELEKVKLLLNNEK